MLPCLHPWKYADTTSSDVWKILSIHVEFAVTFYVIKVLIALSLLNSVTNAAEEDV